MVNITMKMNPVTGRERAHDTDFDEGRKVVRVVPRDENIRKYLKHQPSRVGFLAEGSAEWPNDTFTKRRIAEGDVRIAPAEAPADVPAAGEQKAIEQQQVIDKKSGAKAASTETKPKTE